MRKNLELIAIILFLLGGKAFAQPCSTPVSGAVVGSATVCVGSSVTYTDPTGTPGGLWSSSNTGVATIGSASGTLTAITVGSTTVKYRIPDVGCGADSAMLTVTVVNTPSAITGGLATCPGNADTLFNAVGGGTWSSGSTGVATIDPALGIVYPSAAGNSLITYSNGTCTATATLTVNPNPGPIAGLTAVCRFQTITLTDPSGPGTWSSTVPAAATVNPATGVVTGVGPGGSATNILFTLPTGCYAFHFVSVSSPPVAIIGATTVCQSRAISLFEAVPGGTWTSSATGTATVTPSGFNGIVTGITSGPVTISYTMPSCPPTTYAVTVDPAPGNITGPTAICVGMTTTLADTSAGGAWSSSDTAVHVTSGGVVTSTVSGISATITYTLPTGCYTTAMVNVSVPPAPITGGTSVCQGATLPLADATPGGVWSSTNLGIAQVVDSTGLVTGISSGAVNISYTLPTGCYAEIPFIVNPPVTPQVIISDNPGGIICATTVDTLIATPVNGGVPTYQWEKFSIPIAGATNSTYAYAPAMGDVINCVMVASGVCALQDTVADTFALNVYPNNVSPVVTIGTTSVDTLAYIGETVTFYSNVLYGGTVPTYQWYMNGSPIAGANASSYTTPVYATDTFWCEVNSNAPCQVIPAVTGVSNLIIIHDRLGVQPVTMAGNTFSLFPNPNNGSFTLTGTVASVAQSDVTFDVTNMLGQVMYTGRTAPVNGKVNTRVNVTDLAAGSYLLRINSGAGVETFHFVVGK